MVASGRASVAPGEAVDGFAARPGFTPEPAPDMAGVGAAFGYSVVATIAPGLFPESFQMNGQVAVYFEPAAVICCHGREPSSAMIDT